MKVAIVTGAYKGLGLEWCRQLAGKDYIVLLTARSLEKAREAAESLGNNKVIPIKLDVTNEADISKLVQYVHEHYGQLDLLINNAGINPKDYADKERMRKAFYIDDLDANEMWEILHINSIAPLLMVKHFRPLLKESAKPIVINISSWLGSVSELGFGGHYGYVGSKNLLNVLNKSMANEVKTDRIICVNVNPGWVQTDMGGAKASFTAEQAVGQLIRHVLDKVSLSDSGRFMHYDGTDHPW